MKTTQARSMLFNSVKASGGKHVMIALEEDIKEEVVEYVLSHLVVDKSPGWDGIMNEFFNLKAFVPQLKAPLTMTPRTMEFWKNARFKKT